jgi:hypothetical protein
MNVSSFPRNFALAANYGGATEKCRCATAVQITKSTLEGIRIHGLQNLHQNAHTIPQDHFKLLSPEDPMSANARVHGKSSNARIPRIHAERQQCIKIRRHGDYIYELSTLKFAIR